MATYPLAMKMTMHIDEHLLDDVMERYGFATKTDAVHYALKELDRRKKLREFMQEGMGFSEEELKAAVSPDYDLDAIRAAETPAQYNKGDKK